MLGGAVVLMPRRGEGSVFLDRPQHTADENITQMAQSAR